MPVRKRKYLFFFVLFMEMVFINIPDWAKIYPFPFSTTSIDASTYIYFHFEHWAFLMLGILLVRDSKPSERTTNIVFLGVLAFDYLDWILTCNQAWGTDPGKAPITANVIKLVAFGLLTWRTDND